MATSCGRSWKILSIKRFKEKVIGVHFSNIKYESFIRQANKWGFRRIREGIESNSYLKDIKRVYKSRNKNRSKKNRSVASRQEVSSEDETIDDPQCSSSTTTSIEQDAVSVIVKDKQEKDNKEGSNQDETLHGDLDGIFDDMPQDLERSITMSQLVEHSNFIKHLIEQAKTNLDDYIKLKEDMVSGNENCDTIYPDEDQVLSLTLKQQSALYSIIGMRQNLLHDELLFRR